MTKDKTKKMVTIMTGVAKKKTGGPEKRGELIEQNQDGLEYSDEEDKGTNLDEAMEAINRKGKKELPKVDHNRLVYEPFTKSFYVEVPELARMSAGEVELMREELEGVKAGFIFVCILFYQKLL